MKEEVELDPAMKAEINTAIVKNLPQQVGNALSKELEALAYFRAHSTDDKKTISDLQQKLARLESANGLLEAELKKHAAVDVRTNAVLAREAKAELNELKVELHKEMRNDMKEILISVFRSPITTKIISGQVPIPVEGNPGGNGSYPSPGMVIPSNISTTETTRQE